MDNGVKGYFGFDRKVNGLLPIGHYLPRYHYALVNEGCSLWSCIKEDVKEAFVNLGRKESKLVAPEDGIRLMNEIGKQNAIIAHISMGRGADVIYLTGDAKKAYQEYVKFKQQSRLESRSLWERLFVNDNTIINSVIHINRMLDSKIVTSETDFCMTSEIRLFKYGTRVRFTQTKTAEENDGVGEVTLELHKDLSEDESVIVPFKKNIK